MFKNGAFMKWVEGMEGEVVRKGEMDLGRGEAAAISSVYQQKLCTFSSADFVSIGLYATVWTVEGDVGFECVKGCRISRSHALPPSLRSDNFGIKKMENWRCS